mmetsp:Transcript_6920/g.16181  ORF Transcript_6920/g.16181 Transcript_6920/m.16181 type:complete len:155 (+) Transcript_6920:183-647(+)
MRFIKMVAAHVGGAAAAVAPRRRRAARRGEPCALGRVGAVRLIRFLLRSVARTLPKTQIRGSYLFLGTALICAAGYYQVGQVNQRRRFFKEDKRERRAAILPFLQAEEDARYVRAQARDVEFESRVMSGVPSWEAGKSVYNTREWMPPADQRVG